MCPHTLPGSLTARISPHPSIAKGAALPPLSCAERAPRGAGLETWTGPVGCFPCLGEGAAGRLIYAG